jgi:hypothetical protein
MKVGKRVVSIFAVCLSFIFCLSCIDMMARQDTSVEIDKPDQCYVSPNMDFNSINGLGMFPIFPSDIENPAFADAFSRALTAELQGRQSQWKIIPASDLVAQINQKDLGRGYKNLQADMNTFSGTTGFGAMTQETTKFLKDLDKLTGANSYLLGVYAIGRQKGVQQSLLGPVQVNYTICKVKVILYQVNKGIMWDATHTVQTTGPIENNADALAKSFAAYLGKGTLRQL